jgi:hypothetical protein
MKKSFILHLDSLCVLDKLTDEQAGKFLKIVYQYQKTKELPEMDLFMEVLITPFINQFFRDEKGYERVVERNRENGKKGGRPTKEPKKPNGIKKTQNNPDNPEEPKKADSDNDSDSVNDNDSKKESIVNGAVAPTTKNFKNWTQSEFYREIGKHTNEFPKEVLRSFYEYWCEKSPSGKMKFQFQKTWETKYRLNTWKRRDDEKPLAPVKKVNETESFHPHLLNRIS